MPAAPLVIRISASPKSLPEPLMGGTSPNGRVIAANRRFFTSNGLPWLPVMGEFHFSRYPRERWEREILKMKSGGIDIIATYVFWNHIEETQGQYNWTGNRDLRAFISLCGNHGLYAYPRIGPWAHGECRSGGFPDWLLEICGAAVRQDVPVYLDFVRRLYAEINLQLKGLLWKEGGPVIGVQIENELLDNSPHLRTLKEMAVASGLDVPLYTMTGWGPAQVPEDALIPVFGGYPDAFWDRDVHGWSRASRKHYFFTHLRDDNTIGADMGPRPESGDLDYMLRYPYGTCETGGGMQVSYHRRPYIETGDIAAIAYAKIGSGSNLLGYFMYHGGSNPMDMRTTMQESQQTGYPNDLPVVNYDFQAPLGQYGQARESFHALRPLHLFLRDFGRRLATLPMRLPEMNPTSLDDRDTLRWAVRADDQSGYLFINNYQRIEALPGHPSVQFTIQLPGDTITLPAQPVTIPPGYYGIWPLRMDLDGICLRLASAQPACRVDAPGGPLYAFIASDGIPAEFRFEREGLQSVLAAGMVTEDDEGWTISALNPGAGCIITLNTSGGKMIRLLVLVAAESRQLYHLSLWGAERLLLSENVIYTDGDALRLETLTSGSASMEFFIFPTPDGSVVADGVPLQPSGNKGIFTRFAWEETVPPVSVHALLLEDAAPAAPVSIGPAGVAQAPSEEAWARAARWQVTFPGGLPEVADDGDLLLTVEYAGDAARAYLGGQLINDDFYFGRPWQIGLAGIRERAAREGLILLFLPLRADAPIYIAPEHQPRFGEDGQALDIRSFSVESLRASRVTFVPSLNH